MAWGRKPKLLHPGDPAPAFRLERLEGGEAALEELLVTAPVLLVFFKASCPVCQLTLPFLDRVRSAGRLPIYAISQNSPEDTREFNRHFGVALPTLLDREDRGFPASNQFGISSVPALFLVERDGTISRVIEGWQKQEIEKLGALAGVNPFRPEENVPQWKAG
jgi:peroxiredoxin